MHVGCWLSLVNVVDVMLLRSVSRMKTSWPSEETIGTRFIFRTARIRTSGCRKRPEKKLGTFERCAATRTMEPALGQEGHTGAGPLAPLGLTSNWPTGAKTGMRTGLKWKPCVADQASKSERRHERVS